MKVQRIVANIETGDVEAADAFYRGVLGLEVVMDHGWVRMPDDVEHIRWDFGHCQSIHFEECATHGRIRAAWDPATRDASRIPGLTACVPGTTMRAPMGALRVSALSSISHDHGRTP